MLVILLYVTSGHNIEEFVSAGCCILIFISNVAVLFLLERMEYAASYYRNVNNIACWVYSVRKDGTMHKSKGVTPMQQCSFE